MDLILQNTIDSKQAGEVAFMHCFTADVMPHIQAAHPEQFGHPLGATFSVTMPKLLFVISQGTGPCTVETVFSWTAPQEQKLTTVVVAQGTQSNRPEDGILREFNATMAAGTAGKLVFHFFSETDAHVFAAIARSM